MITREPSPDPTFFQNLPDFCDVLRMLGSVEGGEPLSGRIFLTVHLAEPEDQ